MAVAANADDYAATRVGIYFPGVNPTLDGQCVSLEKWFLGEMCGVADWNAARGNANTCGRTLVAQGLAVEVPYALRRRGDVVCLEYGEFGHVYIQLSGGRVFEENVNMPGCSHKVVDGDTVYTSRIGSDQEAWRIAPGKNPHVYRLKNYNEEGDIPMFNEGDRVNMNSYFFGKDTGAWADKVNKDWKTAMYEIMEDNQAANRLLLNEGDRSNINQYLYGADRGRFKDAVGRDWKQGMYWGVFENVEFKTDQLVNSGDVGNLKQILGNPNIPDSVVGKQWKDFVYGDLAGLIPASSDAAKVLSQVRDLVNQK